jgi:hypothetical protein
MKTTALAMVAAGKAENVNLNTLRALARAGLISLTVRTVRYPERGRTVAEKDIAASLTDAGKAALA